MGDNKIWYYKKLDFPELPLELKNRFDQLVKEKLLQVPDNIHTITNPSQDGYLNYNYHQVPPTQIENNTFPGGEYFYTELTPEFKSWFRENISATAGFLRFSTHKPDPSSPITRLSPHVDFQRSYGLNYVHVPGGISVKTVFYQEQGHPVIRSNPPISVKSPLIKLAEITIPVNTWHLLRTDIVHTVEFMTGPRIRITADPDQLEIDAFESHVVDTLQ